MSESRKRAVHLGTSGWHYDHWQGVFYPRELGKGERLAFYSRRFPTVEINNSFYQLPSEETLESWRETVPAGFRFAAKASRYLTHMKKLKDPEEPLSTFYRRLELLGERLGPILFQLPPRWRVNPERLQSFLGLLSADHRHAFEFRDPSWETDEVYDLLARAGAAWCIYDLEGRTCPKVTTADYVYVRLHGPDGAYQGSYGEATLAGWAGAFSTWTRQGREVYAYFDNDQEGYAAANALRLQEMLA